MSSLFVSTRSRSRARAALVLAAALFGLTALWAPAAGAHSDEGEMTVTRAEQTGPLTIAVEVGITYVNDGHLAEEAEVWVDATSAGTSLEPVGLEHQGAGSSLYAGEITVPTAGEWSLAFSSDGPTASATASVSVTEEPATTTTESTTTTEASTTTEATTTTAADEDDAAVEDEDEDSNSTGAVIVLIVAVAVAAGAIGALAASRKRRDAEDAGSGSAEGPGDGQGEDGSAGQ